MNDFFEFWNQAKKLKIEEVWSSLVGLCPERAKEFDAKMDNEMIEFNLQWRGKDGSMCFGSRIKGSTFFINGFGRKVWKNGTIQEGFFIDDKLYGFGRTFLKNKTHYAGTWMESQRHGKGKWTYSDGSVEVGQWHYGGRIHADTFTFVDRCARAHLIPLPKTFHPQDTFETEPHLKNKVLLELWYQIGVLELPEIYRSLAEGWKAMVSDYQERVRSGRLEYREWVDARQSKCVGTRVRDTDRVYGFGRVVKADGSVFEGFFSDQAELFGFGKVILNNKTAYLGGLCNSQRHGKGTLRNH